MKFSLEAANRHLHARTGWPWSAAFTLTELLICLVILSLLLGIIVPITINARNKAQQSQCMTNMRQIGTAINLYVQDFDETHPTVNADWYGGYPSNAFWVSQTLPYIENKSILMCQSDPTTAGLRSDGTQNFVVSYGLNSNFADTPADSSATAPARTLMVFEVAKSQLSETNGRDISAKLTGRTAITGDGVTLLADPNPCTDPEGGRYATGAFDNHEYPWPSDILSAMFLPARHRDGANYVAADGHSVWLKASAVSAGLNASRSDAAQSHHGFLLPDNPNQPAWPTAEGTENGRHRLTFSLN